MSCRLLLHIGTGKTGSSSIQTTLTRAAADGRLRGVVYPAAKEDAHNDLVCSYQPADALPRIPMHRLRSNPERFMSEALAFRHEVLEAVRTSSDVILSGEYLTGMVPEAVEALMDDLVAAGVDDVRVLAYVREPAALYLSSVQQRLKTSHTFQPPSRFTAPSVEALQTWGAVCPNIHVRAFDRDQLDDGDVVVDFLTEAAAWFGAPVAEDPHIARTNESMSAEGMVVMQRYRRLANRNMPKRPRPDSSALLSWLQDVEGIPQHRPRLRPEVAALVRHEHREDLAALREDFGLDLHRRQTHELPTEPPVVSGEVSSILEAVDEDVVERLLYLALRDALEGSAIPLTGPVVGDAI